MGKRALIFGASGVMTAWSFINELLYDYPEQGIWHGVVALTNRLLPHEDSLWPGEDRLQIASGINLLNDQAYVESALQDKAKDVDKITHVYYLGGYRPSNNISPA